MSVKEEIDKAIDAHSQWKVQLRQAIDTGECESTPERIRLDDTCAFGKWLHYRIDDSYKKSIMYREVLDLHASCHHEAGRILDLALRGDTETANHRMGVGQPFSTYSAQLTRKMRAWQAAL